MRKIIVVIAIAFVGLIIVINLFNREEEYYNLKLEELKHDYAIKPVPSIDHSKLTELQREFATPQDVTEAATVAHRIA